MTVAVVSTDTEGIAAAAAVLNDGGVVLVPTDTVYGIAAKATVADAVDRLFALKRRPADRAIALLVASPGDADTLAALTSSETELARRHWPGALTMVLDRRSDVDPSLGREDGTVAVRCPGNPFVRALTKRTGPLATTSANLSGHQTPLEARDAAAVLDGDVDLIVDGGPCAGVASTVIRARPTGQIEVLRQGAIEVTRGTDDLTQSGDERNT